MFLQPIKEKNSLTYATSQIKDIIAYFEECQEQPWKGAFVLKLLAICMQH